MLAVVASSSPTEQQFILYNGANTLLRPHELPEDYITAAEVFIYGSVTLASESRAAALQAARWARAAGKQVIFDVNLRPLLWPDLDTALGSTEKAMTTATVVKLNEVELEFLTGSSHPATSSRVLLEQGIPLRKGGDVDKNRSMVQIGTIKFTDPHIHGSFHGECFMSSNRSSKAA